MTTCTSSDVRGWLGLSPVSGPVKDKNLPLRGIQRIAPAAGGRSSTADPEAEESREDGAPEKRQKTAEAGELATVSSVHH